MIKSMTGYGQFAQEFSDKKITIQVKTLNSKQLDVSLKIPNVYREKELEIRNMLATVLERGKIELYIDVDKHGNLTNNTINKELAIAYYNELIALDTALDISTDRSNYLSLILSMPNVLSYQADKIDEEEWSVLKNAIQCAIEHADKFRMDEGSILAEDLKKRILLIDKLLVDLTQYESERITNIQDRIRKNLADIGDNPIDENRLAQELIYYLEKLDITEEKVRLKKHLDYFLTTLNDTASQGKKLGFVTQEIGREINTIGSKASHVEIQRIVIMMKDELEKIKEQLGNVL